MDDNCSRQFLTFVLDGERYAVNVRQVREVLEVTRITKLPKTENYMKGIISLRGLGVPVVDLRTKFGLPELKRTKDTSIIVLECSNDRLVVGALADAVQEVIDLGADEIDPVPRLGTRLGAEYLHGIGRKDNGFIMILDMDRILDGAEIMALAAAGGDSGQVAGETILPL